MVEDARPGERGGLLRAPGGSVRLGWRLLAFFLIALLVATAVGALAPAGMLGGAAALLGGSLVAGWLLLRLHHGRPAGALGFYLAADTPFEVAKGMALGVGVAGMIVVAIAALGGLEWTPESGTLGSWIVRAGGAVATLALPAAAEEAFLRGYPLQALAQAWGPVWALASTSVVFGVLHLGNPDVTALAVLNVTAAGFFLGVVYLRTGSLWWATGAHLGWNRCHGFAADLPVSGLEVLDAPLYDASPGGPEWLGGGAFGPEGSLVTTIVVVGVTAACWRVAWLRPGAAASAAEPLFLMEAPAAPREGT